MNYELNQLMKIKKLRNQVFNIWERLEIVWGLFCYIYLITESLYILKATLTSTTFSSTICFNNGMRSLRTESDSSLIQVLIKIPFSL